MTREKINPYRKKVAVSLPLQFKFEAQQLHMSPTTYYDWLKQRAGVETAYDYINARFLAENCRECKEQNTSN